MSEQLSGEQILRERIKDAREARNQSQADVARRMTEVGCKMHQTAVAKIEAGERRVALDEAITFAQVFGVSLAFLTAPAPTDETWGQVWIYLEAADAASQRVISARASSKKAQQELEASKSEEKMAFDLLTFNSRILSRLLDGMSDVADHLHARAALTGDPSGALSRHLLTRELLNELQSEIDGASPVGEGLPSAL